MIGRILSTGAACAVLAAAALGQSGGPFTQSWQAFEGGGARLTGGGFELRGVGGTRQGQSGVTGNGFEHDAGYWPGVCGGNVVAHGIGCAGSGGFVPQLAIAGCPSAGDVETFTISQGLGGSQAFLMFGIGQAQIPIGGGCFLNIAAPFPGVFGPIPLLGAGAGSGSISFPVTVPANLTTAVGLSVTHQAFVIDPAKAAGFVATNGVEVAVG